MISSEENKNWLVPTLIVAIAIVSLTTLYLSTNARKQESAGLRQEFDYAGRPVQQAVNKKQVLLKKDEKIVVGRNGFVYKGIAKNMILIDLYLLDMDPEQPYHKQFLKKDAKKAIKLGGKTYRLLSASNNHLILKIPK